MLLCLLVMPAFGVNGAINGGDEPSKNGKIAFASDKDGNVEIYLMNADGSGVERLTNNSAFDGHPDWSPDGTKIAFSSDRYGEGDIFVIFANGSGEILLTSHTDDWYPHWSPDGTKIVFTSWRDGNAEIYVMNANGTGQIRLTNNNFEDEDPCWSPDGDKIAFDTDRDGIREIYIMNPDGSGQTRLTNNNAEDWNPAWSPDGTKIAFDTDRDGNFEIFVMNADGSGQTRVTDTDADNGYPCWSPDGDKIAFDSEMDGNWEIYAINADGTDLTRLTNSSAIDWDPTWQTLYVTGFQQSGVGTDFTGNVLSVDGTSYTVGNLPASFAWVTGTSHSFSWSSPLTVSIDKRYVWSSTSGQSTGQSGTFAVLPEEGSIAANYTTQYYVRLIASEGGSITEPSRWAESDSNVSATPVPAQGYVFSHWQISGSIWEIIGGTASRTFKVMGPGTIMAVFEIIDNLPPTITVISPANGSTVLPGNITISASYSDNGNINVSSVRLRFDGTIVATGVVVNATGITYTMPLSSGAHTVELTVEDVTGNSRAVIWAFAVGQPSAGFPMEYIFVIVAVVAVAAVLAAFLMRRGKQAAKPS